MMLKDLSCLAQVGKLRKAVAEENLHYLNERDARKLLLLDLNEMYRLKEEMKLTKVQGRHCDCPPKTSFVIKQEEGSVITLVIWSLGLVLPFICMFLDIDLFIYL